MVDNMEIRDSGETTCGRCESCKAGKATRATFPCLDSIAPNIMHTVHVDVAGPLQNESIEGHQYLLVRLDDHSRFTSNR